jgi:hypothetical protein
MGNWLYGFIAAISSASPGIHILDLEVHALFVQDNAAALAEGAGGA